MAASARGRRSSRRSAIAVAVVGVSDLDARRAGQLNGTEGPHDGWLVVIVAVPALLWVRPLARGIVGRSHWGAGRAAVIGWTRLRAGATAVGPWRERGYGFLLVLCASLALAAAAVARGFERLHVRRPRCRAPSASAERTSADPRPAVDDVEDADVEVVDRLPRAPSRSRPSELRWSAAVALPSAPPVRPEREQQALPLSGSTSRSRGRSRRSTCRGQQVVLHDPEACFYCSGVASSVCRWASIGLTSVVTRTFQSMGTRRMEVWSASVADH